MFLLLVLIRLKLGRQQLLKVWRLHPSLWPSTKLLSSTSGFTWRQQASKNQTLWLDLDMVPSRRRMISPPLLMSAGLPWWTLSSLKSILQVESHTDHSHTGRRSWSFRVSAFHFSLQLINRVWETSPWLWPAGLHRRDPSCQTGLSLSLGRRWCCLQKRWTFSSRFLLFLYWNNWVFSVWRLRRNSHYSQWEVILLTLGGKQAEDD